MSKTFKLIPNCDSSMTIYAWVRRRELSFLYSNKCWQTFQRVLGLWLKDTTQNVQLADRKKRYFCLSRTWHVSSKYLTTTIILFCTCMKCTGFAKGHRAYHSFLNLFNSWRINTWHSFYLLIKIIIATINIYLNNTKGRNVGIGGIKNCLYLFWFMYFQSAWTLN